MKSPETKIEQREYSRRHWLSRTGMGLGAIAAADLLTNEETRADVHAPRSTIPAKVMRVIYLFLLAVHHNSKRGIISHY